MQQFPIYSKPPPGSSVSTDPHLIAKLVTTNKEKLSAITHQITLTAPDSALGHYGAHGGNGGDDAPVQAQWELVDSGSQRKFAGGRETVAKGQDSYALLVFDEALQAFVLCQPQYLHLTPTAMSTRFGNLDDALATAKAERIATEKRVSAALGDAASAAAAAVAVTGGGDGFATTSDAVVDFGGLSSLQARKTAGGGAGGRGKKAARNLDEDLEWTREADDEEHAGEEAVDDFEDFDDKGEAMRKRAKQEAAKARTSPEQAAMLKKQGVALLEDEELVRPEFEADRIAREQEKRYAEAKDEEEEEEDDEDGVGPRPTIAAAAAAAAAPTTAFSQSVLSRTNAAATAATAAAAAPVDAEAATSQPKRARTAAGPATASVAGGAAASAGGATVQLGAAAGAPAAPAAVITASSVVLAGSVAVSRDAIRLVFASAGKQRMPGAELMQKLLGPGGAQLPTQTKAELSALVKAVCAAETDPATGKVLYAFRG